MRPSYLRSQNLPGCDVPYSLSSCCFLSLTTFHPMVPEILPILWGPAPAHPQPSFDHPEWRNFQLRFWSWATSVNVHWRMNRWMDKWNGWMTGAQIIYLYIFLFLISLLKCVRPNRREKWKKEKKDNKKVKRLKKVPGQYTGTCKGLPDTWRNEWVCSKWRDMESIYRVCTNRQPWGQTLVLWLWIRHAVCPHPCLYVLAEKSGLYRVTQSITYLMTHVINATRE